MYLEDFLETAEGLPSEIRSKLNEIKMLDEKAEKMKMYCLERREKAFKFVVLLSQVLLRA